MNREEITKFFKNRNNRLLFIIIITGIALMALFGGGEEKEVQPYGKNEIQIEEEERRLSSILEKIDGAGEVDVMISYEETARKNIAYEKTTSSGDEVSYDEKAVLTDGEPMVINEQYPTVRGVVVIAEGAEDTSVKRALREAVSAVLGVDVHKICVYKMSR